MILLADEKKLITQGQLGNALEKVNKTKQDKLTIDTTPTDDSMNPISSDAVYEAFKGIDTILDNINGEVV